MTYAAATGPPILSAVIDREPMNPKKNPDLLNLASGISDLKSREKPRVKMRMPIKILKMDGFAILRAKTPMGTAQSPPDNMPYNLDIWRCCLTLTNTIVNRITINRLAIITTE